MNLSRDASANLPIMPEKMRAAEARIKELEMQSVQLRILARELLEELSTYSQARRDMRVKDLSKWKFIKIKHESDYEFYPNHIDQETIEAYEKRLSVL